MPEPGWTKEEIYLLLERGYALFKQGRYREAAVIFDGVTALDPLNSYARTALAAVCLVIGEPQRAASELSFVLNQNPADKAARAQRCEAYCQVGKWDEALQDLTILRRNGERQHVDRLTWRLHAQGVLAQ
jgi:tetratricopeptide (TPR) repeat protein